MLRKAPQPEQDEVGLDRVDARVCLATTSARPPVATTRASSPISAFMRATIASVWPTKP
jgi:hypothetical protein